MVGGALAHRVIVSIKRSAVLVGWYQTGWAIGSITPGCYREGEGPQILFDPESSDDLTISYGGGSYGNGEDISINFRKFFDPGY